MCPTTLSNQEKILSFFIIIFFFTIEIGQLVFSFEWNSPFSTIVQRKIHTEIVQDTRICRNVCARSVVGATELAPNSISARIMSTNQSWPSLDSISHPCRLRVSIMETKELKKGKKLEEQVLFQDIHHRTTVECCNHHHHLHLKVGLTFSSSFIFILRGYTERERTTFSLFCYLIYFPSLVGGDKLPLGFCRMRKPSSPKMPRKWTLLHKGYYKPPNWKRKKKKKEKTNKNKTETV